MRYKFTLVLFSLLLSCLNVFGQEVLVGNKMTRDDHMQEKGIEVESTFSYVPGDTIIISKQQTHYLTGERIDSWVWYVCHIVQQVGGKRFPDGILIKGIRSWVRPDDLLLLSPVERSDSASQAAIKQRVEQDRQAVEELRTEVATLDEKTQKAVEAHSESIGAEALKADSAVLAREQARRDSIARALKAIEQARRDSIEREMNERQRLRMLAEEEERQRIADSIAHAEQVKNFHYGKQHRFSIGLRGGVASLMQETKDNVMEHWKAGYDALLDLQYAYYFGAKEGKKVNLGIVTGLSVGYSRSPVAAPFDSAYSVTDDAGDKIDYTVSAEKINEKNAQLQLEVPVLFSLRHETGVFMNVGPKIVVPLFSHYNQKITNPNIIAYYPEYGVYVPNETITGKVSDEQQKTGGKWSASTLNVMLTAELGYEWMLKNNNALGIGVYADYSLYDLYNHKPTGKSVIDVGMPDTANGAKVEVSSATDTYGTGLGFFDCGLKLVWHFCFPKN